MSALLTGAALVGLNLPPGSPDFAAAAAVLAALVGAIRLTLGLLNGGVLVGKLPHTVLEGFVCGACWLVFATQVPVIVGLAPPPGMHFLLAALWLLARPLLWQPGTVCMAAVTAAFLLGGRKIHPLFPGAVAASVLGGCAAAAGLPVGATVGAVHAGLPQLVNPASLPWHLTPALLSAGFAIAIAGIAEAAAIGSLFAKEDNEPWSCSQELVSQGACNLSVAAFGGFPVAGSLSRTSLARLAGATSQRAHLITGIAVLCFLPAGAGLLALLPKAVLGALVACAVAPVLMPSSSLLLTREDVRTHHWHMRDLFLGWSTLVVTLVASPRLELGLEVGLVLAILLALLQVASRVLKRRNAAA